MGAAAEATPAPPPRTPRRPRWAGRRREQPIADEVAGFERALASKSCREFFPFVFSTLRNRPPGSPATKEECREEPLLAAQYAHRIGPSISGSREFGTGAILEAPAGKGLDEYTTWVLDSDGRFRFAESEGVFHPQFGTSVDRPEAKRVAEEFVRAVRGHDCAALIELLHFSSRLSLTRKAGGRSANRCSTASTSPLRSAPLPT